ncbi:RING finger protein 4 isoform X2 [Hippocampus zosterae]|uniref:RING finger protein 4 isoform X2 n=1 Tax=Hippocampus zosterae TaxID=109293 RepID=UPI00223D6581|nr:RING finger protein 4 isoform X2 [Hippocampus zosterae]
MSALDAPTESVPPPSNVRRRAETTKPSGAPTRAARRKRRSAGSPLASGCPKGRGRAPAGRAARANARANASGVASGRAGPPGVPAPAAGETIDVMDNLEDSVEEVVDLTSEAAEASHVVDLTSGDSVLLVDEGPQSRGNAPGESYVVSSDDDDEAPPPVPGADVSSSPQTRRPSRMTPGTISCPVCMDTYSEMVESGRLVVSTKCGHVFCSQCLRDALRRSLTCPTCRKRLTPRQYHPLYI